ncbi:unnamed protein product, partial [Iphiclides podalirius]
MSAPEHSGYQRTFRIAGLANEIFGLRPAAPRPCRTRAVPHKPVPLACRDVIVNEDRPPRIRAYNPLNPRTPRARHVFLRIGCDISALRFKQSEVVLGAVFRKSPKFRRLINPNKDDPRHIYDGAAGSRSSGANASLTVQFCHGEFAECADRGDLAPPGDPLGERDVKGIRRPIADPKGYRHDEPKNGTETLLIRDL